jgi:PAS domain S-box-containing protein
MPLTQTKTQDLMATDALTLQSVLDLSPLATATLDMAGKVTRWNAAAERLFGWTSDDVVRGMHPMARAEVDWLSHQCGIALRTGQLTNLSARRPRRDGSFVSIALSASLICDADRNPQGFVALYREDQRGHKPNGLAQLAVGIALEVNSPSQYISDNLRFLHDACAQMTDMMAGIGRLRQLFAADADPSAIWTEVESLCRAAERAEAEDLIVEIPTAIAQSIDGVQIVSQIVKAMKEFAPQPHNVRAAVNLNHAIETTMLIANSEIRYVADTHTVLDPQLPPVWCLPGPINQVVLTLLTNAAHAIGEAARTRPGIGHITISTRHRGSSVELEVADTGTGIPDAMQAHIFDPFFAGAGCGLNTAHGLALAHTTIVHQHGGRIWFESEAGKGSSFFVRLPLRAPRLTDASAPTEHHSCASL